MNFVETAPALIGVVVGLLVWRRHRADRRARVFLGLAASELAFGLPLFLSLDSTLMQTRLGVAVIDGALLTLGLLSASVFMHFGLSFPHARPWLRRGRMSSLYLASVIVGLVPVGAALAGSGAQASVQNLLDGILMLVGPLVLVAGIVACVAIYRSYREMPADERRVYRVPVMGVLGGMVAGLIVSVMVGVLFGVTVGMDSGTAMWTADTVAMAGEVLLPLFFFMAAYRYRLLERHPEELRSGELRVKS